MLENNAAQTERKNPFFEPYNTPHDTVPFNRIEIGDYEEAFIEGIRRDDEEIEKLVNDPETPTFENTIVRVDNENGENYYDLLSRVSTVFSCMLSAETCDELDALAQKMSPILTKHANDVKLSSTDCPKRHAKRRLSLLRRQRRRAGSSRSTIRATRRS